VIGFAVAVTFAYRDALHPSRRGTVRVVEPPPAVSLASNVTQIDYGRAISLSGQVNTRKAGEQVTLTAQPYGQPSPIVLATVVTGVDGTFAFVTKPRLLTGYLASWKGVQSPAVAIAVRPVITFGRATGVWIARAWAARSMARKAIQVQRLSRFGQWVTVKRLLLDGSSRVRFRLDLPVGPTRLRIAMSVNQTGAGYLAAFSREIRWTTGRGTSGSPP
jgi:hypothetical protein